MLWKVGAAISERLVLVMFFLLVLRAVWCGRGGPPPYLLGLEIQKPPPHQVVGRGGLGGTSNVGVPEVVLWSLGG